jgi:hypothetical protein
MRFSLKWILVSMAYAALSAAALTQDGWAYADALWAITLIAVAYSALVAIIASGKQRATAVGFAVFAFVFVACVVAAPDSVPSQRLLVASGVEVGDTVVPVAASGGYRSTVASGAFVPSSGSLSYAAPLSVTIASPPSGQPYVPPTGQAFKLISGAERFAPKLRAANSIGAMLFGILGAVLGTYAWGRVKSETAS